jgi:hypothetical protein
MADTDFDPWNFEYEDESQQNYDDEITDLDQLYEFEDCDCELQEYEFHGSGDTGGTG